MNASLGTEQALALHNNFNNLNNLDEENIGIFKNLPFKEILNHGYDVNFLFKHIYKVSTENPKPEAKRIPNPFMIFRVILRLVASRNKFKIGDGIQQSKLAGVYWKRASSAEKKEFEVLASKFKELHKQRFPNYEYKPRKQSPPSSNFHSLTPQNYQRNVATMIQSDDALQNTHFPNHTPQQLQLVTPPTVQSSIYQLTNESAYQPKISYNIIPAQPQFADFMQPQFADFMLNGGMPQMSQVQPQFADFGGMPQTSKEIPIESIHPQKNKPTMIAQPQDLGNFFIYGNSQMAYPSYPNMFMEFGEYQNQPILAETIQAQQFDLPSFPDTSNTYSDYELYQQPSANSYPQDLQELDYQQSSIYPPFSS